MRAAQPLDHDSSAGGCIRTSSSGGAGEALRINKSCQSFVPDQAAVEFVELSAASRALDGGNGAALICLIDEQGVRGWGWTQRFKHDNSPIWTRFGYCKSQWWRY